MLFRSQDVFAYGLGNSLYFPFSVGATTVLMPERPTPQSVFDTIARYKPTVFYGVPTLYGAMMAHEGGSMDGVRLCTSAGEALPAHLFKRWKDRFHVDILDGIGSTEVSHIYISNRVEDIRPGSTGQLVPGYEAKIVDDQLQEVPEGEIGTVLIKGDSTAAYYWNKHEKTKEAMLGEWFNTDDKFFVDQEGFFYYVGRSNDMLKVGGIWVSPIEVEACLIGHPAVLESAVVPGRDDENLVKPSAYIVLNKGFEASLELEQEIKSYVKKELAHYKFPGGSILWRICPRRRRARSSGSNSRARKRNGTGLPVKSQVSAGRLIILVRSPLYPARPPPGTGGVCGPDGIC